MVAVIAVRISLCLTLIRVKTSPTWTRSLYYFMIFNTIILLALILPSTLRCNPPKAVFDHSVHGARCFSNKISIGLVYGTNGRLNIPPCNLVPN
jgi:hypothetical protein